MKLKNEEYNGPALFQVLSVHEAILSSQQPDKIDPIVIPILQMRKPRPSETSNLPEVICLISGRARVKTRQPIFSVWTLGPLFYPAFYHGGWVIGFGEKRHSLYVSKFRN